MSKTPKAKRNRFPYGYLIAFAVLSAAITAMFFAYNAYLDRHDDLTRLSQTGDAFSSLNTLFAGIGIAGVIIAIIMQSVELRNQQQELRDNTNTILLTSYLSALDSLRQSYAAERANDRNSHMYPPSPELSARLKYRLTTDKLEALIRHLEQTETQLEHLDGAVVARSQQWAETLKSLIRIATTEWAKAMAKRHTTVRHIKADKSVVTYVGSLHEEDIKNLAVHIHNELIWLIEEITVPSLRDAGFALTDRLSALDVRIPALKKESQERQKAEGRHTLDETAQSELDQLWPPIETGLNDLEKAVEAYLLEHGRLQFVKV